MLDRVLSFTYIYSRNLFICATFLSRMFCDEPFFLLESIWRAIKFKPQRQNMMNAAAVLLIWHFPTVPVPPLLHMSSKVGSSHSWVQISYIFNQHNLPNSHKWHVSCGMFADGCKWLTRAIFLRALMHMKTEFITFWASRDIEKMRKPLNFVYIIKDAPSGLGAWLYLFGLSAFSNYVSQW